MISSVGSKSEKIIYPFNSRSVLFYNAVRLFYIEEYVYISLLDSVEL